MSCYRFFCIFIFLHIKWYCTQHIQHSLSINVVRCLTDRRDMHSNNDYYTGQYKLPLQP